MPWRSSSTATEGTLWGRVTDAATGNPIDDATVQVGSMSAVKTDGNGYYTVTLITASGSGTTLPGVRQQVGLPNGRTATSGRGRRGPASRLQSRSRATIRRTSRSTRRT